MENKKNISTDLKIEEFAKELGLQLRLIFLEEKPEKPVPHDGTVKPITVPQTQKNSGVK